ncbi:DUF4339 domain-containing protein [Marinobacter segnicrescens]|uniref:DUF4339 domain-containing protein n=1 Tax=Marinobacter segnicrescens TaxID=430453 RepID=UPI003A9497D1
MDDNNFFSVDRLLEFGLGMTAAQHMVKSMNDSLESMQIPGTDRSKFGVPQAKYFVVIDEEVVGPLTDSEMFQCTTSGHLQKDTYVWMPGMTDWKRAAEVPEVIKFVALCPPPFKGEI